MQLDCERKPTSRTRRIPAGPDNSQSISVKKFMAYNNYWRLESLINLWRRTGLQKKAHSPNAPDPRQPRKSPIQIREECFFSMEKTSRKEKKLKRNRKRNVWKTRTRLERGPRDVINSAKWLNLVHGNMVSMYEWRALPQRGERYTKAMSRTSK